jgi:hypothetical protein
MSQNYPENGIDVPPVQTPTGGETETDLTTTDVANTDECDHIYQWLVHILVDHEKNTVEQYAEKGAACTYCPKCGEKL